MINVSSPSYQKYDTNFGRAMSWMKGRGNVDSWEDAYIKYRKYQEIVVLVVCKELYTRKQTSGVEKAINQLVFTNAKYNNSTGLQKSNGWALYALENYLRTVNRV